MQEVGLGDRLNNFPAQLSGGEQQRVSIARALAKNPKLLLCDEPTGALDYQTGKAILKLLQDMCRERGMTVIVITHNSALTPGRPGYPDQKRKSIGNVQERTPRIRGNHRMVGEGMKKKALRKDFFVEVRKSRNRFLSILFIVALGVSFYSGIQSAAPDVKQFRDVYFDREKTHGSEGGQHTGEAQKRIFWNLRKRKA